MKAMKEELTQMKASKEESEQEMSRLRTHYEQKMSEIEAGESNGLSSQYKYSNVFVKLKKFLYLIASQASQLIITSCVSNLAFNSY